MWRYKQKLELGGPYPRTIKSCWQLLEAEEKAQGDSSLETSEGANCIIRWFHTSRFRDCERMHFFQFQPPGLWRLIVPALRHSYKRGTRRAAAGSVGSIAISYCRSVYREQLSFLVQTQRNGAGDQEEASGQDEGHQSASSTVACTSVFSVTDASMAQQ